MSLTQYRSRDLFYSGAAAMRDYAEAKGERLIGQRQTVAISSDNGSTGALSSTIYFKIPRFNDAWIDRIDLRMTLSAISGLSGGTYNRFVNYMPIALINRIEVWNSGKLVTQISRDEILRNYIMNNTTEEDNELDSAIGNLSTAARNTAAAAAQEFTIEFDELFSMFSIPFPHFLLNEDLDIRVITSSNAATTFIEADHNVGTGVWSFTAMNLVVTRVFEYDGAPIAKALKSAGEFPLFQYNYAYNDYAIGTGQTQYNNALQFINNKHVMLISWMARLNSGLAANDISTLQSLASWQLTRSNIHVSGYEGTITRALYRQSLLPLYDVVGKANVAGTELYMVSYANDLEKVFGEHHSTFTGCRSFIDASDVQLQVNYASSVAAAQTLTVQVVFCERMVIRDGSILKLSD